MKMRKSNIVIIVCILLVIVVVAYVYISKKNSKKGGWGPGMGGAQATVVSVKTQVAEKTTLHDYVATNGEVEPQSSIDVFPDVGGRIVSVNVSLGSQVTRGQVIAEVDPSTPGATYAHSAVYAPISGTITTSPLKPGAKVTTNSTIATIGDVDNLQITADIPERYVAVLKTGLKANISFEAYPGVVFAATVTRVSPVVDSTSRTKEVIMNFDKKDDRVDAGMFAKVILYTQDYKGQITMPLDSVVNKSDKLYAYVAKDDNTVEQREVTEGNAVDGVVQILSGLNEGEKIVVEGMSVLANGSKIKDITNGVVADTPADGTAPNGADASGNGAPGDGGPAGGPGPGGF